MVHRIRHRTGERRTHELGASEAHVDHAHAVVDGPHDRLGHRVAEEETGRRDADGDDLGRTGDAAAPDAVAGDHRDHAGHHGAVADLVGDVLPSVRVVAKGRDAAGEIGLAGVDAGVDDPDGEARPAADCRDRRSRVHGVEGPRVRDPGARIDIDLGVHRRAQLACRGDSRDARVRSQTRDERGRPPRPHDHDPERGDLAHRPDVQAARRTDQRGRVRRAIQRDLDAHGRGCGRRRSKHGACCDEQDRHEHAGGPGHLVTP